MSSRSIASRSAGCRRLLRLFGGIAFLVSAAFQGVGQGLVRLGSVPEPHVRGMVMLLAVNLILYTRAIFIPSSALRTFTVSAIASLPLVVYSVATEDVRFLVWKVAWLLAAISVATAGSAVIYDLLRDGERLVRNSRDVWHRYLALRAGPP